MAYSILVIFLLIGLFLHFAVYFKYNITEKRRKKLINKKCNRKSNKLPQKTAEKSVDMMIADTRKIVKISKYLGIGIAVILLIVVAVKEIFLGKINNEYAKFKVCVWENETLGASVDPKLFMNKVTNGEDENIGSKETFEEDIDDGSIEEANEGKSATDIENAKDNSGENVNAEAEIIEKNGSSDSGYDERKDTDEVNSESGDELIKGNETGEDNGNIEDEREEEESKGVEDEGAGYGVALRIAGNDAVDGNREENGDDNTGHEKSRPDTSVVMGPYDYSPLYLWGTHVFGGAITGQDIIRMEELVKEFMDDKGYEGRLNEILEGIDEDYGKEENIPNRINQFTADKVSNPDVLNAMDYYENAMDQLYLYKKETDYGVLEQSAISAEGAVEREQIDVSGSYNNYINYVTMSVIEFCYISGLDLEIYDSGTKSDVKYRIGKLLYKPSANLENINSEEKFYALCGAYIFLKDAFNNGNEAGKYSVEIAFYYLASCRDMVFFMEPGEERENICIEAVTAYREFKRRGEENPDNSTYIAYGEEAHNMLAYATDILNLEMPDAEGDGEMDCPKEINVETTNQEMTKP